MWDQLFQQLRSWLRNDVFRPFKGAWQRTRGTWPEKATLLPVPREGSFITPGVLVIPSGETKSLCIRVFHNPRLPSRSQSLCSETCSKVVIPAAEVGQRSSPAGWSGTRPKDVVKSLGRFCPRRRIRFILADALVHCTGYELMWLSIESSKCCNEGCISWRQIFPVQQCFFFFCLPSTL